MIANDDTAAALERLSIEVRATFQDLKQAAEGLHADLGMGASMRAVLEHVVTRGAATVPDIARVKNVSRQAVQQIADQLVAAGFADFVENPRHRRSALLTPTADGEDAFRAARLREADLFARLAEDFDTGEIEIATAVLQGLREAIAEHVAAGTR